MITEVENFPEYINFDSSSVTEYLNLENVESFKITRTSFSSDIEYKRSYRWDDDKGENVFTDRLPEEYELFKEDSRSRTWKLTIPEDTPLIKIYYAKRICSIYFLHYGEYERIVRILTKKEFILK